jgi:hypothetical protein
MMLSSRDTNSWRQGYIIRISRFSLKGAAEMQQQSFVGDKEENRQESELKNVGFL